LSLGVDLVPHKVCPFDCVYCQVGPTTLRSETRTPFFPVEEVVADVAAAVKAGPQPRVITFAGSGEPTLYLHLGEVVDRIRQITDLPLLLITNGSLLHRPDVAADAARFDTVAPSLDAADEETFRRVNGPVDGLTVEVVIEGLARFSATFEGTLALELFFVSGVNDSPASLDAIIAAVEKIAPDRVDLNTVVRPTPGRDAQGVSAEFLAAVASRLPCPAFPIARFDSLPGRNRGLDSTELQEMILETLRRRPCTADDLAASLSAPPTAVKEAVEQLISRRAVSVELRGAETYFIGC